MAREYTPGKMIEAVQKEVCCFTLTALEQVVEIHYNTLLKLVNCKIPVTETHLLRFHEASGLSVAYLRDLMGDDSEDIYRRPYGEPDNFYWATVDQKTRVYRRTHLSVPVPKNSERV